MVLKVKHWWIGQTLKLILIQLIQVIGCHPFFSMEIFPLVKCIYPKDINHITFSISVLLSTLSAQFPRACGLKFRAPESRAWRGVRLAEGKLFQPVDTGWAHIIFVCVTPKGAECKFQPTLFCFIFFTKPNFLVDALDKRRLGEETVDPLGKGKKVEKSKCSDLIVLGLPWKTTEQELRTYFEPFGEVLMAQVWFRLFSNNTTKF